MPKPTKKISKQKSSLYSSLNASSDWLKPTQMVDLLEALIFSSLEPLPTSVLIQHINEYYSDLALNPVSKNQIEQALKDLELIYSNRAINLIEVSTGYRFEVNAKFSRILKPQANPRDTKPSKAYLETLTLIAYKQPITRSEIEAVRGVSVSSSIIRDLLEKDWIKVTGHKEAPGSPALYATTTNFLDSFHLKSLNDLPSIDFSPDDGKRNDKNNEG